jgi:hypothetical protein
MQRINLEHKVKNSQTCIKLRISYSRIDVTTHTLNSLSVLYQLSLQQNTVIYLQPNK